MHLLPKSMDATINSATERRQVFNISGHMFGSGFDRGSDRNLNEPGTRVFDQACARSVDGLIGGLIR